MSIEDYTLKEITKDGKIEFFGTITFTKEALADLCKALEMEENDTRISRRRSSSERDNARTPEHTSAEE